MHAYGEGRNAANAGAHEAGHLLHQLGPRPHSHARHKAARWPQANFCCPTRFLSESWSLRMLQRGCTCTCSELTNPQYLHYLMELACFVWGLSSQSQDSACETARSHLLTDLLIGQAITCICLALVASALLQAKACVQAVQAGSQCP